jgi:hypothetical protein
MGDCPSKATTVARGIVKVDRTDPQDVEVDLPYFDIKNIP